MKAEELDKLFDEGEEDILQYFDLSKASRPGLQKVFKITRLRPISLRSPRSLEILRREVFRRSRHNQFSVVARKVKHKPSGNNR
ncbi:hypothetical protein NUACC21_76920 [Scytonema sp. NUACC21]